VSTPQTVLILTHRRDHYTVERVAEAVARRGLRSLRFDTDQFPGRARATRRLGAHAADPRGDALVLSDHDEIVDAREVQAVWMRHVWPPEPASDLDPRFREAAVKESGAALAAMWDGLRAARWINRPDAAARASDKLLQLRLARAAGLEIPRTVLTNEPDEARAFFAAQGGRVVAKMLTPLSVGMDAKGPFVYTSRVREADLAAADGLRHAPMLFQEEVAKARELRVAIVKDELFVGAIHAARTAAGAVDWRRGDPDECSWERDALPEACADSLRALLATLQLDYGAADLIVTPEGRHVFLEVNPAGEWGMLERDLGYPIADALAEALCRS